MLNIIIRNANCGVIVKKKQQPNIPDITLNIYNELKPRSHQVSKFNDDGISDASDNELKSRDIASEALDLTTPQTEPKKKIKHHHSQPLIIQPKEVDKGL
jgi:hypothetical protein